jgi:hypothetical protein
MPLGQFMGVIFGVIGRDQWIQSNFMNWSMIQLFMGTAESAVNDHRIVQNFPTGDPKQVNPVGRCAAGCSFWDAAIPRAGGYFSPRCAVAGQAVATLNLSCDPGQRVAGGGPAGLKHQDVNGFERGSWAVFLG